MDYATADKSATTDNEGQKIVEQIKRVCQEIESATISWAHKNELKSELMLLYKRYTYVVNSR